MADTFTQTWNETFHIVTCYTCGVAFGISAKLHQRAVKNKEGSVYCPACGNQSRWLGKSKAAMVREEMQRKLNVANSRADAQEDEAKRQKKRANSANRSLSATKGIVTKMKNRTVKGICPVPGCKRYFDKSRLERHIKNKHPDFNKEEKC